MDYTIIYKNIAYSVKNVTYDFNTTHRVFKRNGEIILSVPLNSVLIVNGKDIKVKVITG